MPKAIIRVFDGVKYYLYPDSPKPSHRSYFQRQGKLLHRAVWVAAHGPVPAGHEIHHVDHDTLNNDLANLACVPLAEHRRESQAARRQYEYQCALCGVAFYASSSSCSPRRFCCREHKVKFQNDLRQSLKPSPAPRELVDHVCAECGVTFRGIARVQGDYSFCSRRHLQCFHQRRRRKALGL